MNLEKIVAGRDGTEIEGCTRGPRGPKNVAGSCTLNFGATDLPHSYFEALHPKVFRATPEVDLESTVWRPGPSKVK